MGKLQTRESHEPPLISVVIPVYNMEKYIGACLDSVTASSFSALEIICVDDGSIDRSLQILHAYSEKDARVRILTQAHLYAGTARNTGIKAAAGKYIHFLDADDMVLPFAYEKWYRMADEEKADVCESLYINSDAATGKVVGLPHFHQQDRRKPLSVSSGEMNAISLIKGEVIPWNKLYLRDFLISNNIFFDSLICAEDRSFYYDVIFHAEKIVRIPDRLVIHRLNIDTSLDGSDIRFRHFDVEFRSFERIWNIVQNQPDSIKRLVLDSCIGDSMYYYYRSFGTEYEPAIRNQLYRYWQPYLPVLGRDIRQKSWYMLYVGAIAENRSGKYWTFVRFLCARYRAAVIRRGWRAGITKRIYKAAILLVMFFRPREEAQG